MSYRNGEVMFIVYLVLVKDLNNGDDSINEDGVNIF